MLVPEGKVAVSIDWLATFLSRLRHKDPKVVIKKLIDRFFNLWDLARMGGTERPTSIRNGNRYS